MVSLMFFLKDTCSVKNQCKSENNQEFDTTTVELATQSLYISAPIKKTHRERGQTRNRGCNGRSLHRNPDTGECITVGRAHRCCPFLL